MHDVTAANIFFHTVPGICMLHLAMRAWRTKTANERFSSWILQKVRTYVQLDLARMGFDFARCKNEASERTNEQGDGATRENDRPRTDLPCHAMPMLCQTDR